MPRFRLSFSMFVAFSTSDLSRKLKQYIRNHILAIYLIAVTLLVFLLSSCSLTEEKALDNVSYLLLRRPLVETHQGSSGPVQTLSQVCAVRAKNWSGIPAATCLTVAGSQYITRGKLNRGPLRHALGR